MTTQTKNRILTLNRNEGMSLRQISKTMNVPLSTIQEFVAKSKDVISYSVCPNCDKEIAVKKKKGRRPVFCCYDCKLTYYRKHDSLKVATRICGCCGRECKQFNYLKTRFCSRQCAHNYRYGSK